MKLVEKHTRITPPRTAIEVFEMLPEGTLAEVINNTIYMSPAPLYLHQKLIAKLMNSIYSYVEDNDLGDCIPSPIDVYFDNKNVYQPDIIFIAKANLGIVKDSKVQGTPDIAIEILSGDRNFDLITKKKLYEKFGVKEYFVVDPNSREVFAFYLEGIKWDNVVKNSWQKLV